MLQQLMIIHDLSESKVPSSGGDLGKASKRKRVSLCETPEYI
jgi:hypothetical protein